jgi:hypothetical protein
MYRLARQNEMILNATRTVEETREVGIEITNELSRNREKIERSRARVSHNNNYYYDSNICIYNSNNTNANNHL